MAFVTFININHARLFLRDHKSSVLNWKRRCQQSSLAMEPRRWRVWFAPPPGDIIWENMSNRLVLQTDPSVKLYNHGEGPY